MDGLWRVAEGSNAAPMGLQWGEMGENNLDDFLFFFFSLYLGGFYGAYTIPKWLIKVSRHIPILFG